jgi:hypothetical protein
VASCALKRDSFVSMHPPGSCRKGAITNSHTNTAIQNAALFLSPCACALCYYAARHSVAFCILCCPSAVIINNPAASIAFEWKENTRRRFGWQNNRVGRICTLCSVCALGRVNESEPASGLLCTHIAHVAAGRTLCWLPVRRRQL